MEQPQPGNRGAEALLHLCSGSSISVTYHPLFGPHDDLVLFELEEKLLPDFLHERVVLRGQPDEDAVLCTQSKTYSIKFVGTSNSVLLVPPHELDSYHNRPGSTSENDDQKLIAPVIKIVPGSIDLVEVAPRLDKLKFLLTENPYKIGEEEEEGSSENYQEHRIGLYNWNDLINNIQASDGELRSGLQALSAVEINGYWRIVDESYMSMILSMLLNNSVLNDWSLNALHEDGVVSMLESDGFPGVFARPCLHVYG